MEPIGSGSGMSTKRTARGAPHLDAPRMSSRLRAVPVGIGDLEPEFLVETPRGCVLTVDLEEAGSRASAASPTQD